MFTLFDVLSPIALRNAVALAHIHCINLALSTVPLRGQPILPTKLFIYSFLHFTGFASGTDLSPPSSVETSAESSKKFLSGSDS